MPLLAHRLPFHVHGIQVGVCTEKSKQGLHHYGVLLRPGVHRGRQIDKILRKLARDLRQRNAFQSMQIPIIEDARGYMHAQAHILGQLYMMPIAHTSSSSNKLS